MKKRLLALLLAVILITPVGQAQEYSRVMGNWEVTWGVDEFDDRLIFAAVRPITPMFQSTIGARTFPSHAINFMCFERRKHLFDASFQRDLYDRSLLVRIDTLQPFEIHYPDDTQSELDISSRIITGQTLWDLVDAMKAGSERIAIRANPSSTTYNVSLDGFNQAFDRFSELCPTL